MEESIKALSDYRFEKARQSLSVAIKLYEDNEFSFSQNRAYYAVFNAMRSVNAFDEFDSSKHSGVIAHFNQFYVKTGIFNSEVSSIIRRASRLREKSDYEDFYEPDESETKELLTQTTKFLSYVEEYLNGKE